MICHNNSNKQSYSISSTKVNYRGANDIRNTTTAGVHIQQEGRFRSRPLHTDAFIAQRAQPAEAFHFELQKVHRRVTALISVIKPLRLRAADRRDFIPFTPSSQFTFCVLLWKKRAVAYERS